MHGVSPACRARKSPMVIFERMPMKTNRRTFGFWTMARRAALLKLIEQKNTHSECATILGTTIAGVENVLYRIRKERGAPIRRCNRPSDANRRTEITTAMAAAVGKAKAARESAAPPETFTAWFCGDPLPGRSALDRKRLGIADEVIIESQPSVRTNRITLPME